MPVDKLDTLAAAAEFDVCGYNGPRRSTATALRFIHRAAMPNGGTCNLFKVLLTNNCINDCAYCVNQVGRDCRRSAFTPEELANLFMELHRKRIAQGLFLSSAIAGNATRTMEKMIDTVEIIRRRFEFKGYIHLKILPGASFDCVEQACKIANRVSVNMEAPSVQHLAKLSAKKDLYDGILERMRWVRKLTSANESLVPSGQTTQFVVGAAGESDQEIVHTTEGLYNELKLRRVYYSAFRPIGDTRLEGIPPAPAMRQHRLYQTDWLVRIYGFAPKDIELAFSKNGNLPLKRDPKLVIAERQPWLFPIDINKAGYNDLLRVPGIGITSATRIVETRKDHSIDSVEQLKKMRVVPKWAAPFIWFQGMTSLERQSAFPLDFGEDESEPEPTLAQIVR